MFVIDRDHIDKHHEAVGMLWPKDCDETQCVCHFRLYDDDDILYYEGRATLPLFLPLDWAEGYAGCTRIDYYNPDTDQWETL